MEVSLSEFAARGICSPRDCDVKLFSETHPHNWIVLHVKSRQEKALSQDLTALEIPHYLPLTSQRRVHGNRKVTVDAPLFPGYVFLRGPIDDTYRADRTRRVAGIIRVADQRALNVELSSLSLAIRNGVPLISHAWLKRGIRVEVVDGPLLGLRGIVEDRQSLDRVVLQVNMLGSAVSLDVDAACVAALE
jgi:transcription antitermination factor NusG